jgi:hypothetical protein
LTEISYPLAPSTFVELKEAENRKSQGVQEKYEQGVNAMRQEMESKFQQILSKIDVATLK